MRIRESELPKIQGSQCLKDGYGRTDSSYLAPNASLIVSEAVLWPIGMIWNLRCVEILYVVGLLPKPSESTGVPHTSDTNGGENFDKGDLALIDGGVVIANTGVIGLERGGGF